MIHFNSRKCIWKCHLENGGHFVLRKQTQLIMSSWLNWNVICHYRSYKTYEYLIWFNTYYWYFVHTIRWCFASYWNKMIIWGSSQCKYRIIYGLPWITIFVRSEAILIQQWFSWVKKSQEKIIAKLPHKWQKSLLTVTHTLFYYIILWTHKTIKNITDCPFH